VGDAWHWNRRLARIRHACSARGAAAELLSSARRTQQKLLQVAPGGCRTRNATRKLNKTLVTSRLHPVMQLFFKGVLERLILATDPLVT